MSNTRNHLMEDVPGPHSLAVARAGSWSDVSGVSFFSLTFLAPQTAERPSPKIAESGEMLGGRTGGMPPRAAAGRAWGLGGEQSIGGGWGHVGPEMSGRYGRGHGPRCTWM